jgi:hypothetical protein
MLLIAENAGRCARKLSSVDKATAEKMEKKFYQKYICDGWHILEKAILGKHIISCY